MRYIFILAFFTNLSVHAQIWHLNNVNKSSMYPYEYWFQFDNKEDSNGYVFNELLAEHSVISITDKEGNPIFGELIIRKSDTDFLCRPLISDETVMLHLDSGSYTLQVTTQEYDDFTLAFRLGANNQISLNIKLGLAPDGEVYQINAKKRLTEEEIKQVIHCVKETREFNLCSDRKRYYVVMHI